MGTNNPKGAAFAVHTDGSSITFHQHIKPMFTQWDQVQMAYNVQVGTPFDLWSYTDVREHAQGILSQLTKPMSSSSNELYLGMPKYIGPWSQQAINVFKSWMDNGYLEGTPPKTPDIPTYPELAAFIRLSEMLTGFNDLQAVLKQLKAPCVQKLASIYLYRLKTESTHAAKLDTMLQTFNKLIALPDNEFEKKCQSELVAVFPELAAHIIQLWYGTYIQDEQGVKHYGTTDFNQYIYGLVWINAGAHPMGYATYADNTKSNPPDTIAQTGGTDFYWAYEPSELDPATGLFSKNTGY